MGAGTQTRTRLATPGPAFRTTMVVCTAPRGRTVARSFVALTLSFGSVVSGRDRVTRIVHADGLLAGIGSITDEVAFDRTTYVPALAEPATAACQAIRALEPDGSAPSRHVIARPAIVQELPAGTPSMAIVPGRGENCGGSASVATVFGAVPDPLFRTSATSDTVVPALAVADPLTVVATSASTAEGVTGGADAAGGAGVGLDGGEGAATVTVTVAVEGRPFASVIVYVNVSTPVKPAVGV